MNPDADVTYQTVNLFSSDRCFSASFLIVHITFDEISLQFQSTNISLLHMYWVHLSLPELHRQCCADLYVRTLESCFCYFVYLILLLKIENAVYTCFQNSMLLFFNGFIIDIMNIQNNHSLEFEWVPMSLDHVNDWRFSWFCNVFIKCFQDWLNSVQ